MADSGDSPEVSFFKGLAALVPQALSVERHLALLFQRVPEEDLSWLMQSRVSWHYRYFQTGQESLAQFGQDATDADLEVEDWPEEPQAAHVQALVERMNQQARELIAEVQARLAKNGPVRLPVESADTADFLRWMASLKAQSCNTRALCFYGQSMAELCQAGLRGNDVGFLRAVSIDPTVQAAQPIIERLSRDVMTGRTAFADQLQKAVRGPSAKIDPGLHQLRYLLCFVRAFGVLPHMRDEMRYEVFCKTLGLYPAKGKDPMAGVCAFIRRWEASLVF